MLESPTIAGTEIPELSATSKPTILVPKCLEIKFDPSSEAPGSGLSSARRINIARHTLERTATDLWKSTRKLKNEPPPSQFDLTKSWLGRSKKWLGRSKKLVGKKVGCGFPTFFGKKKLVGWMKKKLAVGSQHFSTNFFFEIYQHFLTILPNVFQDFCSQLFCLPNFFQTPN